MTHRVTAGFKYLAARAHVQTLLHLHMQMIIFRMA